MERPLHRRIQMYRSKSGTEPEMMGQPASCEEVATGATGVGSCNELSVELTVC